MILAGIAVLYLIPAGWRLGASDARYHMEQMSLLPSQETWLRMHEGEPDAWLHPTKYGVPRIRKPPMLIWLNLLAWHDLTPENSTVDQRVARARHVALGLAVLGLLGTYLVARLTFGTGLAWRAALVLASMFAVIKQGRLATFDTHLLGWVMLSHAGLFLMLHLRRERGPGWAGAAAALWTVIATAGAIMTKGPVALVSLLPPLAMYALLCPDARRDLLRAGAVVTAGCAVLCVPWYVYILKTVPEASATLLHEFRQPRSDPAPFFYYLIFLGLIWVWTVSMVWRLAAWRAFPRGKAWFPILGFLAGVLILSFAETKRQRYLVALLPYAAMAIAQGWQRLEHAGGAGKMSSAFRRLHAAPFPFLGACAIVFLPLQPLLVEKGVLNDIELPGVPPWLAVLAGAAMIAGGLAVWRFLRAERYAAAMMATALWWNLSYAFGMNFYVDSHHGHYRHRAQAELIRTAVAGRDVRFVIDPGEPKRKPDDRFYFYLARRMPSVEVRSLAEKGQGLALVHVDNPALEQLVRDGWLPVTSVVSRTEYHLLRAIDQD